MEYYRSLSQVRFAISPHGNGLDCHRTWEILFMGAFPIVKRSSLDEMYRDLPVLIVENWIDVDEELLRLTYEQFRIRRFNYQSLYMSYWVQKFKSHML
jgi:hypothetical protein